MLLDEIRLRFKRLFASRESEYSLASPASDVEIMEIEQRFGLTFPAQVRSFYRHYNGIQVNDPQLEVLPIERLDLSLPNRLRFATLANDRHLYFDVSKMNDANQWDIVTEDGFCVTLTMASFWSNRMWTWIEKRRPIWQPEPAA